MKNQEEKYRVISDGITLVKKMESYEFGGISTMLGNREVWYRCSEKEPEKQFLTMVLGGWFGLHKFLEKKYWQGIFYLLTCGCFGVFYLYDLFAMFVGDYSYKAITYVEEDEGLKRTMKKIYYKPLEDKKKSFLLLLLAMGILFLAILLIYQPVGTFILEGVLSEVIDTVIQQMGKEWSL